MPIPVFSGTLATASTQAVRFQTALADLSVLTSVVAFDTLQLATHAHAWLVLLRSDGSMRSVPTKFAAYDLTPEQYSQHRRVLEGGRAARTVGRWAAPANANDPAFASVRDFCRQHGVVPRDGFRVVVAKDLPPVEPQVLTSIRDHVIADLILAVLPHLDSKQRARVADGVRRL